MTRSLTLAAIILASSLRALAFDVALIVQHATCGNPSGSILAQPSGGTAPFTYLWSDGSTGAQLTLVPPGIYSVTVTDAGGATAFATNEINSTLALFPPIGPGVEIWSCEPGCQGAFFYNGMSITGTTPFQPTIDPPGPTPLASPYGVGANGLCPGSTYTITVVDGAGCIGVYGPVVVVPQPGPNILSASITPSCPDGSTGSLTVMYDEVDSLYVTGPGQTFFMPTTNPFTLTNLPAGEYIFQAALIPSDLPENLFTAYCYLSDTLVVDVTTEPCGMLNGTVFADVDADCAQSVDEPGLPYRVLTVEPGNHLIMTNEAGAYSTTYFHGSYSLNGTVDGYTAECTTLPAPFTLDEFNPIATIDLPMSPTFGPDLAVHLFLDPAVPGFAHGEHIAVANDGPFSFTDVVVDLSYDGILIYVNSDLTPDLVEPGHLQWTIAAIGPFTSIGLNPEFLVPADPGLIGTLLISDASITLDTPDSNAGNDFDQGTRTVTASFDPNDKLAETSSRLSTALYYLDEDGYVDYTIRFQNTGTGPAYNVYLLDTISPLLDLTTFSILAASHDFEATLDDPRLLRFGFPNIMLPDSGSNMIGSQGFISFRLRPVGNLIVGQQLVNAADIFFDFNEPVRTNDAVLTVEQSTGLQERSASALVVYPNPVADVLRIDLPNGAVRIDVIAADGRQVLALRTTPGTNQLDTRAMMPGAYTIRVQKADGSFKHARCVKH